MQVLARFRRDGLPLGLPSPIRHRRCYGFCVPEPGGICGAGVVDGGAVATGLVELSALRNAGTGRRRRGSGVRSVGHASVRQSVDKTAKNKDTDNCDERDCTSTPALIRAGAVVWVVVRHSVSLLYETPTTYKRHRSRCGPAIRRFKRVATSGFYQPRAF